jgi:hypothetical protein
MTEGYLGDSQDLFKSTTSYGVDSPPQILQGHEGAILVTFNFSTA